MVKRAVFVLVVTAALALCLSPAAGASTAPAARAGFVETPEVSFGDSDGDGLAEAAASGSAGGPCACWCPSVGGAGQLALAGQVAGVDSRSVMVLCGTRLATTVDPNAPDPAGGRGLDGDMHFRPGGFGRIPRR